MSESKQIVTLPLKHLAGALLFTVFLGPVGLLYATELGGIVMIVIGLVMATSKMVLPVFLVWIVCCVWSVMAVNRYNKKLVKQPI